MLVAGSGLSTRRSGPACLTRVFFVGLPPLFAHSVFVTRSSQTQPFRKELFRRFPAPDTWGGNYLEPDLALYGVLKDPEAALFVEYDGQLGVGVPAL